MKILYILITVLIFANIIFGPLVRATDSGLACPDWPLCHGKFIPEYSFQIAMEVGHRFYSGAIGILIFWGFLWIFFTNSLKSLRLLATLSIFFLGTQVTLGALTVTKLLDPATVNLHLLNAVLLLAICLTISMRITWHSDSINFKKFTLSSIWSPGVRYLSFLVFLVGFQLYMGGRVSSHYSGMACPDFPTCYGEWFPEMVGTIRYQMEHRWVGYLLALSILFAPLYVAGTQASLRVKYYVWTSTVLVFVQIAIGAMNVLHFLPNFLTAIHTAVGVLIFLTIYMATLYSVYDPVDKGKDI
jgi:cytochrome c oxidase assembly protein subunit 15